MTFPGSVARDTDFQVESTKLTTTDATSTLLWSKTIPKSSVMKYRITCVGIKSDASDRAVYVREGQAYRSSSGNATVGGSDAAPVPDYESDASWGGPAITANTSTQKLEIAVVGKASTTINWRCRVEFIFG
jgi:hypothetical protein